MNDDPRADDEGPSLAAPEPSEEVVPEVSFIVPAAPYESIATDDAPAAVLGPETEDSPRAGLDPTPTLEAVAALGEGLHRKLDGLLSLFERGVRAEATREKVVDRLHAELQEYKQDLLFNVLRPLF